MITQALLTLDRASILLPVQPPYPDVATISAGEIIKSVEKENEGFIHNRRNQLDVEPFTEGGSTHWPSNIATLADKQAFSVRMNGQTTRFTDVPKSPKTIEIEPLDRGCILIGNYRQLPFGVYTTDARSYRIRKAEKDGREVNLLEYRPDNHSEWSEIESAEYDLDYLVSELANEADLIALDRPTFSEIKDAIETHFGTSHETAKSRSEELTSQVAAIAEDTAFDQSIPLPAPLFTE